MYKMRGKCGPIFKPSASIHQPLAHLPETWTTPRSDWAPTIGQIFTFQFPGRFLQQDLYAWDISVAGISEQLVKPVVVMSPLLQARLATLQLAPKNDLNALQSAAEQGQSAYKKAQTDLPKTYTSNIISLAQSLASAADESQYCAFLAQAAQFNLLQSAFTGVKVALYTTAAQEVVNNSSRSYSQAL